MSIRKSSPRNPHFDEDRIIWSDDYSGLYEPVHYGEQFDAQWRFFLEKRTGFYNHTGVETSDPYIEDRIFELTGVPNYISRKRAQEATVHPDPDRDIGGRLYLEPKFPVDFFEGKRCLDLGCGAGRWTRALKEMGGIVKSTDVSEHGLKSTRRFNDDVEKLDLFDIAEKRPDLHEQFDFVLCWGVIMCTHDPKLAFQNVARAVRPGGYLYIMVYAPTYHNSPFVLENRRHYHKNLSTSDERLQFAYEISEDERNAINLLDMLNTFYNWTIPENVIHQWYSDEGFGEPITLNRNEPHKCAFHVFGQKEA